MAGHSCFVALQNTPGTLFGYNDPLMACCAHRLQACNVRFKVAMLRISAAICHCWLAGRRCSTDNAVFQTCYKALLGSDEVIQTKTGTLQPDKEALQLNNGVLLPSNDALQPNNGVIASCIVNSYQRQHLTGCLQWLVAHLQRTRFNFTYAILRACNAPEQAGNAQFVTRYGSIVSWQRSGASWQ